MHRIQCSEIWGGIRNRHQDICSGGITASLYSSSCDGGKGGDIYYLSVCDSDLLTRIAIADVVGHGETVSEVSQFIFDALKARMNDASGDQVLTDINHIAVEHGFSAMTTAAIVAFYKRDNNLYFSYAGHHPALVKRKDDRNWFEATIKECETSDDNDRANLPLAVLPDAVFTQQALPLVQGDRVFLYTDGLIEAPAPDRHEDMFGIGRLKTVMNNLEDVSLPQVASAVLDELNSHTDNDLTHDDVTMLAVEIN